MYISLDLNAISITIDMDQFFGTFEKKEKNEFNFRCFDL